ncbi:MAG: glycosyltransferase family 4 protein [Anaerolineae bacterium]
MGDSTYGEAHPPRPLSVCLVSAAYHPYPSGVSEHVAHLAAALSRQGHRAEVLTTRHTGLPASPSAPEPEPVPVTRVGRAVRVPLNGSFATLPLGLGLPAQVKRHLATGRFDIVHCHGLFPPEISYWALRYSRSVNVVTFLSAGFGTTSRGASAFRRLFRRHLQRIDGRVAISRRALETFEPYVPGDCRVIPCGVDIERFNPHVDPLPPPAPRPSGGPAPTVLFVGRLDRRKGLSTLIDAMPRVVAAVPGSRLVVVGDGPQRARTEHRVADLGLGGRVAFEGHVGAADLPRYYAGADVYCSPALGGEALGIVLLEAMASGTPVVASDIPGYDEAARRDIDALLRPPGDVAALADALVAVLRDDALRARLAASGSARAASYAWPVVAERTVDYYRELIALRRHPASGA